MESTQREDSYGVGPNPNRGIVYSNGSSERAVPYRIPIRWPSTLRRFYNTMGGQKIKHLPRIRKWAAENACTLTFLSFMFGITWLIMVIQNS